jgi:hypothetical protein
MEDAFHDTLRETARLSTLEVPFFGSQTLGLTGLDDPPVRKRMRADICLLLIKDSFDLVEAGA